MTLEEAKLLFPSAVQVVECEWNGKRAWKIICVIEVPTVNARHRASEVWHYIEDKP